MTMQRAAGTGQGTTPSRSGLRKQHRRVGAVLGALAVTVPLAASAAAPASAAPPEHKTVEDPVGTGAHPFLDSACAALGFDIDAVITFQFTDYTTTFTDASGTPVRVHTRTTMDATIVNTKNDRTLDADAVRVVTADLVDGTVTLRGVRFRYSAPGEGTLFLTAGRWPIVPPGEFSGRDDFGDPEAFRPVCTYLAGG